MPSPKTLIAVQRAWDRTYRALADPAHRRQTTILRRRLLELSVRVWCHPYWRAAGSGQRVALRVRARELESEVG
ncbi:hypothetical protein AB0D27_37190 [Streptomyces sp. NPDC048415]|uniref:hypothetical protein n=1 Tax=Streptomyces sp. NPDC048415 TaxID=3154822 RepID=UPI003429D360